MAEPNGKMAGVVIRIATPDDAESIRRVYAPFAHTPVTFEEEEPDPAEFRQRMEGILTFYPGLVAEAVSANDPTSDGERRIIGFAYAHRQSERAAYDWNAELSIYLDSDSTRRGLGSALYEALLDLLSLQGVRCVYSRVTLPNPASERLHERFGFATMGIQRNAGFKCGAWRDVAWYAKQTGPFDDDPERPVPFPEALARSSDEARLILTRANRRIGDARA